MENCCLLIRWIQRADEHTAVVPYKPYTDSHFGSNLPSGDGRKRQKWQLGTVPMLRVHSLPWCPKNVSRNSLELILLMDLPSRNPSLPQSSNKQRLVRCEGALSAGRTGLGQVASLYLPCLIISLLSTCFSQPPSTNGKKNPRLLSFPYIWEKYHNSGASFWCNMENFLMKPASFSFPSDTTTYSGEGLSSLFHLSVQNFLLCCKISYTLDKVLKSQLA